MRFLAVLLAVALTGPSAGAVICEFACAAEHSPVPAAGSCHEHDAPASSTTVAAGHECHDISSPDPSTIAGAPQVDPRALVETDAPLAAVPVIVQAIATPPRAVTHAPPQAQALPLRI